MYRAGFQGDYAIVLVVSVYVIFQQEIWLALHVRLWVGH